MSETRRQYYYRVNECSAVDARSAKCICWHDEGTGPMKDEKAREWREIKYLEKMGRQGDD